MLTKEDRRMLRIAYDEAKAGYDEGGCPIGSVLARGGEGPLRPQASHLSAPKRSAASISSGHSIKAHRIPGCAHREARSEALSHKKVMKRSLFPDLR